MNLFYFCYINNSDKEFQMKSMAKIVVTPFPSHTTEGNSWAGGWDRDKLKNSAHRMGKKRTSQYKIRICVV